MSKMQSIQISDDDCKKYGISIEDFQKYDKNGDHLINANEFFGGAMNNLSIFDAFKSLALQSGSYVDNDGSQTNKTEGDTTNRKDVSNQYSLLRPNVKGGFLANHYDYMA